MPTERREARVLRARTTEALLGMVTLLAVLHAAAPAHAQQESVAESLFRQAREEMKRGEPTVACPKFEESYRLDPSNGTLLNLALCQEALGNTATAWTKLRQFLDSAPAGDSRLPLAREKIAELEAALPWVRLVVAQADDDVIVQLDDVELRDASLSQAIPVNPGEHVVQVKRPTGESNRRSFRIFTAEKLDLHVESPPRLARPALPDPSSAPRLANVDPAARRASVTASTTATPNGRSRERALGYGLGAVGVAGLVTTGVFGLMALQDRNVVHGQCPNHECDSQSGLDAAESGARNEKIASIALVTGALGLVTGGVLLWHAGRATTTVSVGANHVSLSLVGFVQ